MTASVVTFPAQVNESIRIAREENENLRAELKDKGWRADQMANRIQGAVVLDLLPEWIVTGDPKYPTLARMLETVSVQWAGDTDATRAELRFRISQIRLGYLMPGGPAIALECFRCGAAKPACVCCEHRLSLDANQMCDRCPVADDPADREVFDAR